MEEPIWGIAGGSPIAAIKMKMSSTLAAIPRKLFPSAPYVNTTKVLQPLLFVIPSVVGDPDSVRHAAAHLSSAALGMLAAVNVYLTASILGQDWPSAQDTLPQQRQDEDSDANHRPDLSDIIGLLRYDIFLRGWSRRFLPALRRVKG